MKLDAGTSGPASGKIQVLLPGEDNHAMNDLKPISKFLLYFLGTAFGFFADRSIDALLPAPDESAVAMLAVCIALAGALALIFFLDRHLPRLRKKASQHARTWRSDLFSVPNALTASRLVLAGSVLVELLTGRLTIAFWLYLAGLLTDLFDGMIARALDGATDWGKQFDAEVDAIFNAATGAGLLWVCARSGNFVGVTVIASLLAIFVLRRLFTTHEDLPKYLSGFFRLVFVALFLILLPAADRPRALLAAVVLLAFGAWYEYRVMHPPAE